MKTLAKVTVKQSMMLNISYCFGMFFILIMLLSFAVGGIISSIKLNSRDIIEGIPFCLIFLGGLERLLWFWYFRRFPKKIEVNEKKMFLHYFFKFQTACVNKNKITLLQKKWGISDYYILKTGFGRNIPLNKTLYEFNKVELIKNFEKGKVE